MGNKSTKRTTNKDQRETVYTGAGDRIRCSQQKINPDRRCSLNQSLCRPWSRTSRRRWSESTLTIPYRSCRTAWPVTQLESLFLPQFPLEDFQRDNKYKKLPEISRGAFGDIYPIVDLETNELFALKVLSKSKVVENGLIKQVTEEVQIQRACGHHPFIAKCPLNWQSRKHLYIASEYIEGGELWQLLDKLGALPAELVRLYVAQIALAIDFLHNAGVIYRDLKPENVLLDGDANAKLIDFGLSKWLRVGQTTGTVCGTPQYMAPEILQARPYGHAADWWSLGVVACLMMTAKKVSLQSHPQPEGPPVNEVVLPNEVDAPSQDLLRRLLEVQPQKRLHSVRALKTIAFFKDYSFEDVTDKKLKARDLLVKHFGEEFCNKLSKPPKGVFEGFDS